MEKLNKNNLAKVMHFDLYGRREDKYEFLKNNSISTINWNELSPEEPYNFFVPKDFDNANEYEIGFKVDEMFKVYNSGVKTDRDELFIDSSKNELELKFKVLLGGNISNDFINRYRIKDSSSFKITDRIISRSYSKKIIFKRFSIDHLIINLFITMKN